jgi:hypothetical protein
LNEGGGARTGGTSGEHRAAATPRS